MSATVKGLPTITVEWAPNDGPLVASPTWVDITQYVRSISTRAGRQYELDSFAAGTLDLTLITDKSMGSGANGARLFDYEFTTGTYFGSLIPNKQIRVRAVANSTTYDIFRGYVQSWGQTIEQEAVYLTPVKAIDAFIWFEQTKLPSSAWSLEVQRDTPTVWFRLGETDTVRVTDSSAGGNYGLYDNVEQGAEGLVPNDDDASVNVGYDFDPADSRVIVQNPSLFTGYPFTFEFLFRCPPKDQDGAPTSPFTRSLFYATSNPATGIPYFQAHITAEVEGVPGRLRMQTRDGSATVRDVYTNERWDDDKVHHVAFVLASSSSHLIYVDGVDKTLVNVNNNPSWPGPFSYWALGNTPDVLFGTFGLRGLLDECVGFDGTALSSGTIATHALAARTGWDGDDTGARMTRFLDAISWPSALRSIDTGISVLGPANWSAGASALEVMQSWADTEYGLFHIGPDGFVVWRSRHYRYLNTRATTVQANFGDAYAAGTLPYLPDGFSLPRDETLIRNPVTASREGGISVTVSNAAGITKYGPRTWASPTTEDSLDSAVRDRATWLLNRYKDQGTRLKAMTVSLRRITSAANQATVLGLKIGDRINVKRTPMGVGNQISVDQWIEGVSHDIDMTAGNWTVSFTGSPVETQTYLILDDATLGKLDTGTLAY